MADPFDAYAPAEIAGRVEALGVKKARAPAATLLLLAGLAGAFISLGAIFYLVVVTGTDLGFGVTRLLGGLSFCLGLILVVIAGAELFTGNNLVAMAWASRDIRFAELLRSWLIVYAGNVLGACATAALVFVSATHELGEGAVGDKALAIGMAKAELPILVALGRGIRCNALVCLAVWLARACRSVTDKILAILFPISAFVAVGFEHSIANWFFLPYALALQAASGGELFVTGALQNLTVVTMGNVLGGTLLVAGVYWLAYLRPRQR